MTSPRIISSQRHRDEDVIAEKRLMQDYGVSVSPAFELFGEKVCPLLDGHHSWEAAILDGIEPLVCELSTSDDDRIGLLKAGKIEDFLTVTYIDSDLYDVRTGHDL